METSRGIVKVVITSAEPLKKKSLDSVQAAVLSMVGAGKQVRAFLRDACRRSCHYLGFIFIIPAIKFF